MSMLLLGAGKRSGLPPLAGTIIDTGSPGYPSIQVTLNRPVAASDGSVVLSVYDYALTLITEVDITAGETEGSVDFDRLGLSRGYYLAQLFRGNYSVELYRVDNIVVDPAVSVSSISFDFFDGDAASFIVSGDYHSLGSPGDFVLRYFNQTAGEERSTAAHRAEATVNFSVGGSFSAGDAVWMDYKVLGLLAGNGASGRYDFQL